MEDKLVLGGKEFNSRFILGSGKYNINLIKAAVEQGGAEIITLALRRANTQEKENILDHIPEGVTLLPNTSGARNAEEAVRIARLSRAMGLSLIHIYNSDVPKQIRLCGELFGKQEQAEELVDFYQKPVDYINQQLKQVTDRKKVYWEYGNDYSTCIPGTSNDGWHNMILMAGGINIFGDASLAGKDIDPEQILTEDPDLIVKIYAGKNVIGNSGVFTAPPQEEFAEKAEEMLERPGWKDLKAVKEGNFYINTAFMSGGLGKMIGAAYMAKWLYPDLMTDLDPDAIFTQWMKYQGFEPNAPHYYHVPAQDVYKRQRRGR